MSSYDLQRVTALLIRLPERNRGAELEPFLKGFDLTEKEREQARFLSEDRELLKFGRIMETVRESKVTRLLKISGNYLSEELMSRIWRENFEPQATTVRFTDLPESFMDYVVRDEKTLKLLAAEAPPFIPDLLRFEAAMARFRMKHFSSSRKLPEGSLLVHRDFSTLSIGYDIQGMRKAILVDKKDPKDVVPEKRDVRYLFLKKPDGFDCKTFEIDATVANFLEGQLEEPVNHQPLPESYGTLVKLGICKEFGNA